MAKQSWNLRMLAGALALMLVVVGVGCGNADDNDGGGKSKPIVAANYGGVTGDVIDKDLAHPYAAAAGVDIQHVNVGTGFAAKLQAQKQAGNVSWDAIEGLAGADAALLWSKHLLQPLPAKLRARLEAVSLPHAVTDYGVALGNTGIVIACNMDVVKRCPTTPAEFWDTKAFPGRRAMIADPVQAMASALIADGVPPSQLYPMDVDRAFRSLERIKPSIDVWTTSGDQQMQVMRDGQVAMSFMWNGRAKSLIDDGVPLKLQWAGSLVNPNYMVVVKGGPNTAGALKYLEWYATHPKAQSAMARDLAYGMSNKQTLGLLSPRAAALLPAAHAQDQAHLDPSWWVQRSSEVQPRWQEFLAG